MMFIDPLATKWCIRQQESFNHLKNFKLKQMSHHLESETQMVHPNTLKYTYVSNPYTYLLSVVILYDMY